MADNKKIYEVEFATWFSIPLYVSADNEADAIEAAKKTFERGYTTPAQSDADWLNDWKEYSSIRVTSTLSPDECKPLLFDAEELLEK